MLLRWFCVVLTGVWSSGCITMLQIQKDKMSSIKRVAIAGYAGTLNLDDGQQKNSITGTIGAIKNSTDYFSGKRGNRRQEQAAIGYAELSRRLAEAFSWELVDRNTFASVGPYQRVVERSGDTFRDNQQYISGVLTQPQVNWMKPEEQAAIVQQMGADAMATVDIRYDVGKTGGVSIGGMGSTTKYPVASVHFKLVDARGQLIWEDYQARGQVTSQGLRTTMGAEVVENETEVLTEAATSAFDALLARYRNYQPPPPKQ